MFYDHAKIWVEGGAGGDGVVSFRREAHVPRGGPDGGDGGRGGDAVLVCDSSKRDLGSLRRAVHHRAGRGGHGQGAGKHGARGKDAVIAVPPGTTAMTVDGTTVDLTVPGHRAVIARGGTGGGGNRRFATATRQAPRFAEQGMPGESGWVELRLKLLADAGLVGKPNAGKSSLLSRLTRATPKVADYPFTTLSPVLGTIEADDRQLVLADIPGLIEGAAQGAGLGHEFLGHVERCRVLIHVVELAPPEGDPVQAHEDVRAEIAAYEPRLAELPEIVVLNKCDLLPESEWQEALAKWRERRAGGAREVLAVSAATGEGLEELSRTVLGALDRTPEPVQPAEQDSFRYEHRTYRPAPADGFTVVPAGEGSWRLEGPGVEALATRHDLSNEEALAYVEERLHAIGAVRALRAAGFEDGEELELGGVSFDFWPER